jgi:hypothetical protein
MHHLKRSRLICAVIVGVIFPACSFTNLSTSKVLPKGNRITGLPYFLPKARIQITGGTSAKSTQPGVAAPQVQSTATPPPSDGGNPSKPGDASTGDFTITVTEIFEADNTAPYYLKQERNYVFDDQNDLRTNGNFLLTTGNVTTEDETPQIVGTVASIAAEFIQPASALKVLSPPSHPMDLKLAVLFTGEAESNKYPLGQLKKDLLQASLNATIPPTYVVRVLEGVPATPKAQQLLNAIKYKKTATIGFVLSLFNEYADTVAVDKHAAEDVITNIYPPKTLRDLRTALAKAPANATIAPTYISNLLETIEPNLGVAEQAGELLGSIQNEKSVTLDKVLHIIDKYPLDAEVGQTGFDDLLNHILAAQKTEAKKKPIPFTVSFDPYVEKNKDKKKGTTTEFDDAQLQMNKCGFDLEMSESAPVPAFEGQSDFQGQDSLRISGIVFRPPKFYLLKIKGREDTFDVHIFMNQTIAVPDRSVTLVADYSRMLFVKRTTNIGFTNGMLTSYSQSTPSIVLGFLGIPKAIITALLPIPGATSGNSGSSGGTTKPTSKGG